jgi:hypothetical protein
MCVHTLTQSQPAASFFTKTLTMVVEPRKIGGFTGDVSVFCQIYQQTS